MIKTWIFLNNFIRKCPIKIEIYKKIGSLVTWFSNLKFTFNKNQVIRFLNPVHKKIYAFSLDFYSINTWKPKRFQKALSK